MKCFTVTKGCTNRFRCLDLIKENGWDPHFVCDTKKQSVNLTRLGVDRSSIFIRNSSRDDGITGVSRARDFTVNNLMPRDEWCIWIDDNVSCLTGLRPRWSEDKLDFNSGHNWRKRFTTILNPEEIKWYIDQTIKRAEDVGTIFCGFATEENYYFRANRWQQFGYCRTQFALYKNDGSTWFPFDTMVWEDGYKSMDVVARYGQIVINRHMKPVKPQFEKGGIGSFDERLPHLQDNCSRLVEMFPGLVKYPSKGTTYGTDASQFHLTFAKRSVNTVNQWRRENGYAKD